MQGVFGSSGPPEEAGAADDELGVGGGVFRTGQGAENIGRTSEETRAALGQQAK